jgi:hypothetical protein
VHSCGEADPLIGCARLERREGVGETETHHHWGEIDPELMSPPPHTIPLERRRPGCKKR